MNILHLHTGINKTCGISKTIYLITKYSNPSFKHFVIGLNGDALNKFQNNNINIKYLDIKNKSFLNHIRIMKYIKRFIKENKIDIIHSHHRYFDFVSYLISLKVKVKRITSVQSVVYKKTKISYKSDILLAAGDSVKKHLVDYFKIPENKIFVFNNFVDPSEKNIIKDKVTLLKELNIPEKSFIIGYVGRFSVEEKGIDILLKAFEIFNNKNKNSCLIMAGEGQKLPEHLKTNENVILVTSSINVNDYYNIFNCIVLPSRVDPFPLVALESGLMKIPFIGSEVNGISEIIDNKINGLLFKKEDINELVNCIEYFCNYPDKSKEFSEKLNKKILDNYTIDKSKIKLENIYRNLMKTN